MWKTRKNLLIKGKTGKNNFWKTFGKPGSFSSVDLWKTFLLWKEGKSLCEDVEKKWRITG